MHSKSTLMTSICILGNRMQRDKYMFGPNCSGCGQYIWLRPYYHQLNTSTDPSFRGAFIGNYCCNEGGNLETWRVGFLHNIHETLSIRSWQKMVGFHHAWTFIRKPPSMIHDIVVFQGRFTRRGRNSNRVCLTTRTSEYVFEPKNKSIDATCKPSLFC